MNIIGYNLAIQTADKKKIVSSIQYDTEKSELFYHFMYSKGQKRKLYSYLAQKETGRPGHASWHTKGSHIKLDKGEAINVKEYDSLFSNNQDLITLLCVHSFYPFTGADLFLDVDTKLSKKFESKEMWLKGPGSPFSIIVLISPIAKSISIVQAEISEGLKLPRNEKLGVVVLSFELKGTWRLDCLVTPRVLSYEPDVSGFPYYSGFKMDDIHLALQNLFAPS